MSASSVARIIGTVILLIILAVGGVVAYLGYTDYKHTKSTLDNAVETDGVITSKNIERSMKDTGTGTGPDTTIVFSTSVKYNYTYENKKYSGDDITASKVQDESYGSREKAESVVGNYNEGENVTVYVDSRNPEDSFLQRRGVGNSFKVILIGLVLCLISLLTLVSKLFR